MLPQDPSPNAYLRKKGRSYTRQFYDTKTNGKAQRCAAAVSLEIRSCGSSCGERIWNNSVRVHRSGSSREATHRTDAKPSADQLRPVRWKIAGEPLGHKVRVVSEVGHCAGTERPRIATIHIVEHPRASVITSMLKVPSRNKRGEGCAGVGVALYRTVELEGRINGRVLYDGSVSPPKRRWPRW